MVFDSIIYDIMTHKYQNKRYINTHTHIYTKKKNKRIDFLKRKKSKLYLSKRKQE